MLDLLRGSRRRGMAGGHFRSNVWDPVLILAQIVSMQSFFYTSLGLWICVVDSDLIGMFDISLDQVFNHAELDILEDSGRANVIAFVLSSLTCSVGMWYIVQRTKQCLDFTTTMFFIHLVLCTVYMGRIPQTVSWWVVNILCLALTTVLAEFLCMRTEMRAIPLNSAPRTDL